MRPFLEYTMQQRSSENQLKPKARLLKLGRIVDLLEEACCYHQDPLKAISEERLETSESSYQYR